VAVGAMGKGVKDRFLFNATHEVGQA
jgi:hypothetical protein